MTAHPSPARVAPPPAVDDEDDDRPRDPKADADEPLRRLLRSPLPGVDLERV
jgi:hypothetical protein